MFYDFITNDIGIFIEKMRVAFAKAYHIFSTENIVIFHILTFEILTKF